MCLYPRISKNKKYINNKKNNGNIPIANDYRTLYVPIACGKCIECMKAKSREWAIRLAEEIRDDNTGQFVTLTFSEESINELKKYINNKEEIKIDNINNEIAKTAVRLFFERWRKKYKKSVKHWLVTELGHKGTERIHIHGIIFTKLTEDIKTIWKYGWVHIGEYVNEKTINYITKYIYKIDKDHKNYTPKILTSAGIGKGYIKRGDWEINIYKDINTKEEYTFRNGTKAKLPIYYRNKIYNEEEKEKLWINKMNKGERYIMGEKIKIKNIEDLESFNKLQEYYRIKNKKLGYGKLENYDNESYKKLIANINNLKNEE